MTTEVVRAKLRRVEGGKDPNDLDIAGVLKGAVEDALRESGRERNAAFPFIYACDMGAIEQDNYLIDGWVPEGGIHVLYSKTEVSYFCAMNI